VHLKPVELLLVALLPAVLRLVALVEPAALVVQAHLRLVAPRNNLSEPKTSHKSFLYLEHHGLC
jgi:hypothetical protein